MMASVGLWLALTLPSLFIVHRLTGWPGVFVYLAAAGAAVRWMPSFESAPRAVVRTLAIAAGLVVLALFVAIYPAVNTSEPERGSDDDDAHDVGAAALLRGESPYAQRTYLGNALHQLPGSFLLALPFSLAGSSALQNLFWLAVFLAAVARERSGRDALRLMMLIVFFSPAVLHGVVTGTAHVANAVFVTLGLWWVTRSRRPWLAGAAWGVALCSRPNFLFWLPLAWAWLRTHRGPRVAARVSAAAFGVMLLLAVPFYAHAPGSFGPLEAANRLTRFDGIVPHASVAIVAVMAAYAVGLASSEMSRATLFRNAALIQAVPVTIGLAIVAYETQQIDLEFATYATFAAWPYFMSLGVDDRTATPSSAWR